jgi:hypothetical protein
MEAFMRAHHVISVVAVLVIVFGAKQYFFPPTEAEANLPAVPSASVKVLQMHRDMDTKSLPVQKMRDMTFAFDSE